MNAKCAAAGLVFLFLALGAGDAKAQSLRMSGFTLMENSSAVPLSGTSISAQGAEVAFESTGKPALPRYRYRADQLNGIKAGDQIFLFVPGLACRQASGGFVAADDKPVKGCLKTGGGWKVLTIRELKKTPTALEVHFEGAATLKGKGTISFLRLKPQGDWYTQ